MENKTHHEPSKLPYKLLKQITNNFDKERILGSGGFGTVYKGVYENRGEIAVKVLHNISGLDDKEFKIEFDNLRGLKHPNIVELVGFCNETEEELVVIDGKQVTAERVRMALCFEYVQNGNLNRLISDEKTGLTWHARYKIIKGICEGLKYLREGLKYPIMHFDLKPDNILLNKGMVPKIADFGLSRLLGEENTRKTLSSLGTRGYLPPEFIKHQIISREFDIFSLGVIIVRIMTGHENYNSIVEMPTRKSVKQVHENWKMRLRGTLSHSSLEVYCNQVQRCIEIALKCLILNRQERPTIQDIVCSLNETEMMIGDRRMPNEQFFQVEGEFTLPSDISNNAINSRASSENSSAVDTRFVPLSLIKEMTDDFSETRLVGQGMHGRVYKGVRGDGHVIAVKSLPYRLGFDDRKLEMEIATLKKVHHQNIIQFLGYCCDTDELYIKREDRFRVAGKKYNVLCFEYMSGSLEQYLSLDMSSVLDWQTQYGIIKGICEGLRYLHDEMESPFLHMNLKPRNILMDGQKMLPKIGGFGLGGLFPTVKSSMRENTSTTKKTLRYIPPEYIDRGVMSKGIDIFSLGVIILELITGKETYWELYKMSTEKFVGMELEKWRERLQRTMHGASVEGYCEQVKKCLEIGVKCREDDRHKRPTIAEIIRMLNKEQLLEVHPQELCFLTERKKKPAMISSSCLLHIKNKGDDRVAFRLVANSHKRYLQTKEPLCGVVSPRCSYTLTLTMRNKSSGSGGVDFFTMYSIGLGEYDLLNVDKDSITEKYDNFFKEAIEEVQQVKLNVVCDQGASSSQIITTADAQEVLSIDVHPTEPWIMTTNQVGSLGVWNFKTMTMLSTFDLGAYEQVHVAKFIAREKWLVIGDRNGDIHVCNYEDDDADESIDAHERCITTLVVHPTSSFVLSSSKDDDYMIKLWDWRNGWKCTRKFGGHTGIVTQVTFNPENTDSFASASLDGTVKVWSVCSDGPSNMTLKLDAPGLYVDYFTRHNRQHLTVGCEDKTAQIWELEIEKRVHELEGHEDYISAVGLHPGLSVLVTGSLDGTVRVWDSTTYKLENIIGFNLGAVYAFGCRKGSKRIVVGCHQGIAMLEIPLP